MPRMQDSGLSRALLEMQMLKPFWKNCLAVSPQLHIHLLNDPEIPHLVISPSAIKSHTHPKLVCTCCEPTRKRNPNVTSNGEWTKCGIFIRRNTTQQPNGKLLMWETTQVHHESVTLSERIYTQKATLYDSLYVTFWRKPNDSDTKWSVGTWDWGLGGGDWLEEHWETSGVTEIVYVTILVVVTWLYTCDKACTLKIGLLCIN